MNLPTHFVINFVLISNSKVLLERQENGNWKLPGGHIEKNETPIEAVKREAKEELGIEAEILSEELLFNEGEKAHSLAAPFSMFCHQVDNDSALDVPHRNIGLVYIVTTKDEPKPHENQELGWFSKEDLATEEISSPIKKLSQKALEIFQA
jgi:8-oxo-dGTP pyrophosphatase MutT (NUDIX family)